MATQTEINEAFYAATGRYPTQTYVDAVQATGQTYDQIYSAVASSPEGQSYTASQTTSPTSTTATTSPTTTNTTMPTQLSGQEFIDAYNTMMNGGSLNSGNVSNIDSWVVQNGGYDAFDQAFGYDPGTWNAVVSHYQNPDYNPLPAGFGEAAPTPPTSGEVSGGLDGSTIPITSTGTTTPITLDPSLTSGTTTLDPSITGNTQPYVEPNPELMALINSTNIDFSQLGDIQQGFNLNSPIPTSTNTVPSSAPTTLNTDTLNQINQLSNTATDRQVTMGQVGAPNAVTPLGSYSSNQATAAAVNAPAQNNLGLSNAYNDYIYGSVENPYLDAALQRSANQADRAYSKMEGQATDNLLRNVLPQLRNQAISNGQMGSSRQGIAEGMALDKFATGLQDAREAYGRDTLDAMMQARANEYAKRQDRGLTALNQLGTNQYNTANQNALYANQVNLGNLTADTGIKQSMIGADANRYQADARNSLDWAKSQLDSATRNYQTDVGANTDYYRTDVNADLNRYTAGLNAQTQANSLDSLNAYRNNQYNLQAAALNNQVEQAQANWQLGLLQTALGTLSPYTQTGAAPTGTSTYVDPWSTGIGTGVNIWGTLNSGDTSTGGTF